MDKFRLLLTLVKHRDEQEWCAPGMVNNLVHGLEGAKL